MALCCIGGGLGRYYPQSACGLSRGGICPRADTTSDGLAVVSCSNASLFVGGDGLNGAPMQGAVAGANEGWQMRMTRPFRALLFAVLIRTSDTIE